MRYYAHTHTQSKEKPQVELSSASNGMQLQRCMQWHRYRYGPAQVPLCWPYSVRSKRKFVFVCLRKSLAQTQWNWGRAHAHAWRRKIKSIFECVMRAEHLDSTQILNGSREFHPEPDTVSPNWHRAIVGRANIFVLGDVGPAPGCQP